MKEKLAKLLNVKSIVTFILTVVFAVLALTRTIEPKDMLTVYLMVISFYFGTQKGKADAAAGIED